MKKFLTIIFCIIFIPDAFSQSYTKNYTSNDGLPSNNVYEVIQDNDGFIWIGTDAGLSKFDGYRFENYTLNDGLGDNEVLDIISQWENCIY